VGVRSPAFANFRNEDRNSKRGRALRCRSMACSNARLHGAYFDSVPALPKAWTVRLLRSGNLISATDAHQGAHMSADFIFRVAIIGLFLFSAVLASMLLLSV
jgi:hypothetical protein